MATTLVLFYAVGLPVIGAALAWAVAIRSWRSVRAQIPSVPPGPEGSTPRSRFIVLATLPGTLILFGVAISFLLAGVEGEILEGLRELAAQVYGVAGLLTGVGFALVYWRGAGVAAVRHDEFGRVVTVSTLPETTALFGFAIAFLLLGYGRGLGAGISDIPAAAQFAALFMMLGSLGAPVGAIMVMSAYDLKSEASWKQGLRRGVTGTVLTTAFFALAYFTLSAA